MDEEFKSFLLKAPLKKTSSRAKCSFDYYLESLKDDQRLETLKEDGDPFQKHRRDGQARRSLFPFNISGIDDINIDSENEDYGDGNENFFSEGLDESLLSDFANEISFEDAASSEEDSLKHCHPMTLGRGSHFSSTDISTTPQEKGFAYNYMTSRQDKFM
eukprot:gene8597-9512_t